MGRRYQTLACLANIRGRFATSPFLLLNWDKISQGGNHYQIIRL